MSDNAPKLGDALRIAAIARVAAQANAAYYTELIGQGIAPDMAERMTFNATQQLYTGGAELIRALNDISKNAPEIIKALEGLIETPAIEMLAKTVVEGDRQS